MDNFKFISGKLFDDIAESFSKSVISLAETDDSLLATYQLIMTALSSIVHMQLDLLVQSFAVYDSEANQRDHFLKLIQETVSACVKGYDSMSLPSSTKH